MRKSIIFAGLVIVAVAIGATALLDTMVKSSIETTGSDITGTAVSVADIDVSLTGGQTRISGLRLANPAAFGPGDALRAEQIGIDVDLGTLFDDSFVIEEIVIDSPEITYALTAESSNLGQILEAVSQSSEGTDANADKSGGGSIVVANLYLRNTTVRISVPGLMQAVPSIVIPEIHLTDLSGTSVQEIVFAAGETVIGSIETVVGEVDNETIRQHIQALSDTAGQAAVKLIEGTAGALKQGLRTIFETKPADAD